MYNISGKLIQSFFYFTFNYLILTGKLYIINFSGILPKPKKVK